MSRRGENLQLMIAKGNLLTMCEEMSDRRCWMIVGHAKEISCLLGKITDKELISRMYLRQQTKSALNGITTKAVVKMSMSTKKTDRAQPIISYVLNNRFALSIVECSAVNNHTFLCIITKDICILL